MRAARRLFSSLPALLIGLAGALSAAGCSSRPSGYGIHFTLILDGTIPDATVKKIASLEVATQSSIEPFYTKVPTADRFEDRKAEITYRPQTTAGTLAFVFRVRDGGDALVGVGSAEVPLVAGVITDVTVNLVDPATLPFDMGPRYDFSIVDFSMPDLTPPPPPPDMARIRDMTTPPPPPDMTTPPPPPDMSMAPAADMTALPDLSSTDQ